MRLINHIHNTASINIGNFAHEAANLQQKSRQMNNQMGNSANRFKDVARHLEMISLTESIAMVHAHVKGDFVQSISIGRDLSHPESANDNPPLSAGFGAIRKAV